MKARLRRLWHSSTQRVMSLGAAGMALALLTDVLIVRRFGFTSTTDALVIALTLPRLIGTVGRDATKFSLMTVFIQAKKEQGESAFADLGARVLNLFLGLGLVLTAAGIMLAGPIVGLIGWGLEPGSAAVSATMLRLAAGIALFSSGSAVLEVMLNSQRHFTITALRNAITPTVVIVAILMTWQHPSAAYWTAGAFTLGYGVYFLLLVVSAWLKLGFRPDPRRVPKMETLRRLRGAIGYPLAGFGVRQAARVAERAIASLGPSGSVTAYYAAYRLLAALQNLVGVSVALTGQPKLTEHDLSGDRQRFAKALMRRVRVILLLSVPVALMMMVFSGPIIRLLYGRGGMNADGLELASAILCILGPAVVFYCLTPVLNSALYARKRYGAVFGNMCLAAASNVLLALGLFDRLGVTGVAWAATLAAVLSVLNLVRLLHRQAQTASAESTSAQL